MIKFEFSDKAYREYIKKREHIPNLPRIRPEGVSLFDVLIEEQKRMSKGDIIKY